MKGQASSEGRVPGPESATVGYEFDRLEAQFEGILRELREAPMWKRLLSLPFERRVSKALAGLRVARAAFAAKRNAAVEAWLEDAR